MTQVHTENHHPSHRVDARRLSRHLAAMLVALGRPHAVVDVQLVDDAEIRSLNRQWRNIDSITDVLSFALEDGSVDGSDGDAAWSQAGIPALLGDIVISLDTAARQATEMRRFLSNNGLRARYSLWQETCFLATHGLLHLLGHDHQSASDAERMEGLERRFIASVTTAPVHDLDRTDHAPAPETPDS